MKKKLKIFLSVFLLIVVAGAGTIFYLYQAHQYKNDDKKLTKLVDSGFQIKLPNPDDTSNKDSNDSKNTGDNNPSGQSDNSSNSKQAAGNTADGQTTSPADSHNATNGQDAGGKTTVTADSIIAKYIPSFKDLEAQANAKVDSLVTYAVSDYKTRKANGENPSYIYFYSKYSSAGHVLEASTDTAFSTIYNALTAELKHNGFSGSEAQELKDQYTQLKKSQQNSLVSQAISHLK